jgi:hypothetical protein
VQTFQKWWGEVTLELNQTAFWSLGDRQFIIQRHAAEWQTWDVVADEPLEVDSLHFGLDRNTTLPDNSLLERHLFKATDPTLYIAPALADRPVTTRPATSLNILPGESTRLFVSTPLWFQIYALPEKVCFFDKPFWRPSDSWFGPSTIEGELCYSKHTDARLQLDLLERRVHRAITPVNVFNHSDQALVIDRFNLPVPMLRLFADDSGHLWTEAMTVTREQEDDATELTLDKNPPEEAGDAILIAEPRIEVSKHRLIRSLSSLFA